MSVLTRYFEPRKAYGAIFIRLVVGWRLIDGTQDNVFNWERMVEFRDFLAQYGMPFPLLAAHVSVYAQFIAGILYIVGAFVRPAAVVMIVNFIVALLLVHVGQSFQEAFAAWMMLFGSLFLLVHGAGKISVDDWWRNTSMR